MAEARTHIRRSERPRGRRPAGGPPAPRSWAASTSRPCSSSRARAGRPGPFAPPAIPEWDAGRAGARRMAARRADPADRGVRAGPGRPRHPADPPPVLGRPGRLPARVLHHEVQPQALRRRRLPARSDRRPPGRPRAVRAGLAGAAVVAGRHPVPDHRHGRRHPAAAGRGGRRADRPAAHAGLPRVPRARPATR